MKFRKLTDEEWQMDEWMLDVSSSFQGGNRLHQQSLEYSRYSF